MLDEDHAAALHTKASGEMPNRDQALADHRERVIRAELERRVEFFDLSEDAEFGRFGAKDWALCTVACFVLPILVAWWAI